MLYRRSAALFHVPRMYRAGAVLDGNKRNQKEGEGSGIERNQDDVE